MTVARKRRPQALARADSREADLLEEDLAARGLAAATAAKPKAAPPDVGSIDGVRDSATEVVRRVWSSTELRTGFDRLRQLEPWIAEQQVELTAIPAPTGAEEERAHWMAQCLRALGLRNTSIDAAGNVISLFGSADSRAAIAVTAHLDTVFPARLELAPCRLAGLLRGPGIADNGAGLVALLALGRLLVEMEVPTSGPILLVANVGEEGEGNLRGMRYLFKDSNWRGRIRSTIVLDGPGNDHVTVQALASRRAAVTFRGPGGHSWSDAGAASAIISLARAVLACAADIQTARGSSSLNIGLVEGGQSVNSIAAQASMKVDIRAVEEPELARVYRDFKQAVQRAVREENASARDGQVSAEIAIIGDRPPGALKPGSYLLNVLGAADDLLGIATATQTSSTDANIPLSMGREAIAIGGGGRGGGIHTLREWFDPTGRELGLKRLLLLVLSLAGAT